MKVAMITGGGSGIGRVCAIALAEAGYAVVLTGRTMERLRETEKQIKGESLCVAADVTDPASVKNLFTRGPVGLQERILWEHALVVALTGSAFSRAMRFPIAEEAFLAGLMHDIGKSVMVLKFPESYGALLRRLQEEGGDGLSMELDAFGFDHAMVGEALLASWNLAEGLEAVARWHHDPLQARVEHQRLVALVALGNQMAFDLQVGIGMPDALAGATWEAMDILHLNESTYQEHRTSALEALERDKALITDL